MKDTAVICFQRANPPTKSHYQFFRKVIATAQDKNADPLIFLSTAYNAQKDALPWELKVHYISDFFNNKVYVSNNDTISSISDALEFIINRNYKNVYILTSTPYEEEVNLVVDAFQSNNEDINFDTIEVISISNADPDTESASSTYSTAQAHNAVLDNDIEKFRNIVMAKDNDQVLELFSMMKAGLGLTERLVKSKARHLYY